MSITLSQMFQTKCRRFNSTYYVHIFSGVYELNTGEINHVIIHLNLKLWI